MDVFFEVTATIVTHAKVGKLKSDLQLRSYG